MKRIEVNSFAELNSLIGDFKHQWRSNGFSRPLSNFFPNPAVNSEWIEDCAIDVFISDDGCLLLVHHTEFVDEIYYVAVSESTIVKAIDKLKSDFNRPVIVEQISKGEPLQILTPSRCLMRLSHVGKPSVIGNIINEVERADKEGAKKVKEILCAEFDPITDRIPSDSDFKRFVDNGDILVIKDSPNITGFLIYELAGQSIHLRYWWTNPLYRGKGVGGKLLKEFFRIGQNTSRQYLWVDETNDLALPCYLHYGFSPEGLKDYIQTYIP